VWIWHHCDSLLLGGRRWLDFPPRYEESKMTQQTCSRPMGHSRVPILGRHLSPVFWCIWLLGWSDGDNDGGTQRVVGKWR
jgi:hypothetical protein